MLFKVIVSPFQKEALKTLKNKDPIMNTGSGSGLRETYTFEGHIVAKGQAPILHFCVLVGPKFFLSLERRGDHI